MDGLLFYKVDRAARNLFDDVELERLETEYNVPLISISQPTEYDPAGRMMRRTLANTASFFTEQMAVDISRGIGNGQQLTHTMTYASDLIECGHCGHKIAGELKIKKTKNGPREYMYYRCTKYSKPGHPRTRVTEVELDCQVLALFAKIKIDDEKVRDWFRAVLASKTKDAQADTRAQRAELQRQETLIAAQKDRLLNLRLNDQVDEQTFNDKQTELRNRLASIKLCTF